MAGYRKSMSDELAELWMLRHGQILRHVVNDSVKVTPVLPPSRFVAEFPREAKRRQRLASSTDRARGDSWADVALRVHSLRDSIVRPALAELTGVT